MQYTGKSKTGFVPYEFCVKFLDPVWQDAQTLNIGIRGDSYRSVATEDPSESGTQLLFEWLLVCHELDQLVRNLNSHLHFDGATELAELFLEVLTTVQQGSTECLIEIWNGIR